MTPPGGKASPWTTPVIGPTPARTIVGFWHIGAVGDWQRIAAEQWATLQASGLYDASERIVVGFIGGRGRERDVPVPIQDDPKLDAFVTDDVLDYEFPTLARVWQEAQARADGFLCYYLHTKGASMASKPLERAANAWRKYMEYFTLERWQECRAVLSDYETCGVELQGDDSHYSGNFWWATSDYVRKLPDAHQYWAAHRDDRLAAEFYLCQAQPKAYCFNDFFENLYDHEIPPESYRR
jgi:hypothetical protein